MNTQQASHRIPKIKFRVLIIGRANAGKTSILQRICDTTDSPIIYREERRGRVRVTLDPSMDRGEHSIDDELVFSNHDGYIFHDSRGIESGAIDELQILQRFIRRKCQEKRLGDRLHAIWYCVPMDNQRPQLDLKFFKDICPDQNVPVIAVFTKYDQFRRNVQIYVEDFGSPDDNVVDVEDKQFQEHYLGPLGENIKYVRLEKMHMQNMRCDTLIETTAGALTDDIVGLMLLAAQRGNLKLSVTTALRRVRYETVSKEIVRECLFPFPYIWYRELGEKEELEEEFEKLLEEARRENLLLERKSFFGRLLSGGLGARKAGFRREFLEEEAERGNARFRKFFREKSDPFVNQIMSLPIIRNLSQTGFHDYRLIFAVILILKHSTFLSFLNMSPQSALTHAEVDYREANIDSRVQQYLTPSSQRYSDELFADFILTMDMTCRHMGVSVDSGR